MLFPATLPGLHQESKMSSNTVEKVQPKDLKEYKAFFKEIKEKILTSQVKAALAVNHELINLYWEIGSKIHLKQKDEGWGAKTVENLAKDLKSTFPEMKSFSLTNIKYMVQFAKTYPEFAISQQVVGQIPWGHNILLLQKLETLQDRIWYAHKTIEHGWSRNVLLHWLDSGLHKREGKAITNFQITLPSPQSDLAHQALKDPYCFDFLTLRDKHDEQELESGLLDHVQRFLLELGAGFSLVGRQVHLEVGDQDFYIDLLFYHYKLRCFIVVELFSIMQVDIRIPCIKKNVGSFKTNKGRKTPFCKTTYITGCIFTKNRYFHSFKVPPFGMQSNDLLGYR